MTAWKIDPVGVQGVLDKVQAAQTEIANDLKSDELQPVARAVVMPTSTSSARQNGVTGSVMSALNALFESETDNIATIQNHIAAGVFGVANAAYEYAMAQNSMATNTGDPYAKAASMQDAMFGAATTGDLSYFSDNGHFRPDGES